MEARELYLTQMKDGVDQQGVSSEELRSRHEEALNAATRHFQSLRNQPTQEQTDPDLEQLQKVRSHLDERLARLGNQVRIHLRRIKKSLRF